MKRFKKYEVNKHNLEANNELRFTNYKPSHFHSDKEFSDPDPISMKYVDVTPEREEKLRRKNQLESAALERFIRTLNVDSPIKQITIINEDSIETRNKKEQQALKALRNGIN